MRYIALVVAYDGTDYGGSQRQANAPSVQGELETALAKLLGQPTAVTLAGRTDAGVHATGQCAAFAMSGRIPTERLPLALNGVLDKSIRILSAREVGEEFHPRFSARRRTYRYSIDDGAMPNPLLRRVATHLGRELDVPAMQEAAQEFVGCHDFVAWQSAGSPTSTTVRTVYRLTVKRRAGALGSRLIEFEIEADAFLYRMVRNIVGALLRVGLGELSKQDVRQLMEGRDRRKCPPPAAPQGLCLIRVKY